MDKINHCINHNRFIPIDTEELSALELIGKGTEKTNELVDKSNEHEERITNNEKKKVSFDDMKEKYKFNNETDIDYRGKWFGLDEPTLSDEGMRSQVQKNRDDIIKTNEQLESITFQNKNIFTPDNFKQIGDIDDTMSFKRMLSVAKNGGEIRLTRHYIVSEPITFNYNSSELFLGFKIKGIGGQSAIIGRNIPKGRGVVELLGVSNIYAIQISIEDFTINCDSSCNKESFALVVGDSRNLYAKKIICNGANGMLMKIADSSSYATICAKFEQCFFDSNFNKNWFSNDDLATCNSVTYLSGGAKFDNVLFESCSFVGTIATNASICEFNNCQFSCNPHRPISPKRYRDNVVIEKGSATFNNSYFEDCEMAIYVIGLSNDYVNNVVIDSCHFSGITNYKNLDGSVYHSYSGVFIVEQAKDRIGKVSIKNTRFGEFSNSIINNSTNREVVQIENITNIYSLGVDNEKPIKGKYKDNNNTKMSLYCEVVNTGYTYLSLSPTFTNANNNIEKTESVSKIKISFDKVINVSQLTLAIFKNGSAFGWFELSSFTKIDDYNFIINNPYSLISNFKEGDIINYRIYGETISSLPIKCKCEIN